MDRFVVEEGDLIKNEKRKVNPLSPEEWDEILAEKNQSNKDSEIKA